MACTTILVGRKASYDGSTIIARNDDGMFEAKKVIVTTSDKQFKKYKSKIGHLEIELPKNPLKYTSIPNIDKTRGLWPACGINEANVSMTATETITSNPLVYAADPLVRYEKAKSKKEKDKIGGIGEEDLVTLVLPYIKTAREGVIRTGKLLEKYGTYEMNGMAFADEKEIWWLETIGGHHYIAVRVPDDEVVMMPNRFGLDHFDLNDALGKQTNNMCSKDMKEFIKNNHLDANNNGKFNPRLVFGSHSDSDHIYNTPRSWYMLKYFAPRKYDFDKDYTPISDDIPFSVKPEKKVTIEEVKYILNSYFQGTDYDPYLKTDVAGKYRTIGVPNTDCCGILQIRGYMPKPIQAVQWLSLGGSTFTACIPMYTNVSRFPKFYSQGSSKPSTDDYYWASRLIAALTDANYDKASIEDERYQNKVLFEGSRILKEYDDKMLKSKKYTDCEEANEKISAMLQKESTEALGKILKIASVNMKTMYHRGDN